MALIHYPKEIEQVSEQEFTIHIDRLLRNIRQVAPGIEYIWAREWQGRKKTPHLHLVMSVWIEPKVLRRMWASALRSTHPDFAPTSHSPYVGFTKRPTTSKSRARYMSKIYYRQGKWHWWKKKYKQKFPPPSVGFSSGGCWGASRVRGRLVYRGTTAEMKEMVRTVNLIAKSIERSKRMKKGKLKSTNRKGATLFKTGPGMLKSMRTEPSKWGIKEARAFGLIRIDGSAKAHVED